MDLHDYLNVWRVFLPKDCNKNFGPAGFKPAGLFSSFLLQIPEAVCIIRISLDALQRGIDYG